MSEPVVQRFAAVASDYARFRPRYPPALYQWLAAQVPGHDFAWDVACGSGQATVPLASHFASVLGSDASARQVAQAEPAANVRYACGEATRSGLPDACADLVTVAQALHWFELGTFYGEAARVLRPGGLLVAWTYNIPVVAHPGVQAALMRLHREVLGPWWPAGRIHVDHGYARLPFPGPRLAVPTFLMRAAWPATQLLGYVATWSAVAACRAGGGADPLPRFADEIAVCWPADGAALEINWPFTVLACRAPWLPGSLEPPLHPANHQ
jgi:SAM-dependent methyltransferase